MKLGGKSFGDAYQALVGRFAKRTFPFWEQLGLHVTPVHFYEPIPDTRALDEAIWSHESSMVGVDLNPDGQLSLLDKLTTQYRHEYEAFPTAPTGVAHQFHLRNRYFGAVDAEVLYALIRHFRPTRVIEVGSGYSTLLAAQALVKNQDESSEPTPELIAIEPYPNEVLRSGVPGLSQLITMPVQQVSLSEFETLGSNDVLFIDSSHTLRIGGDVQYEFLEILPRLAQGVLVHVHDIFLPAPYPRSWVMERRRFWTEQYLLQAWLAFNNAFEVLWAGNYLHLHHPERLEEAFPSYDRLTSQPGSFWMRRTS